MRTVLNKNQKRQAHVLCPPNQRVADQPSPLRQSPIRTRTILHPSKGGRKPLRENHQALAVKGERHPMYKGRMLCADKTEIIRKPCIYRLYFSCPREREQLKRDPCFESAPFTNVQRTNDVASQSDICMLRAQCDRKHMSSMTKLQKRYKHGCRCHDQRKILTRQYLLSCLRPKIFRGLCEPTKP